MTAHLPAREPGSEQEGPTLIRSVQKGLWLLEVLADRPEGTPAKALARLTGFPLATTYHLLRTLAHDGYAESSEQLWRLGPEVKRFAP